MRRIVIDELLDSDSGTAREIADSLEDLRRINRWFGGISTTEAILRRALLQTRLSQCSVLDVAAGSGDVICGAIERVAPGSQVTLLDAHASHLPPRSNTVVGDALHLPFADGSFDFVSCSLFAHHLEPAQLAQFAREALRVARHALLINDLVRHPMHLALVYASLPLHRRISRYDSVASLRRSYTPTEMRTILSPVGSRLEISRFYLFRMGVILWK